MCGGLILWVHLLPWRITPTLPVPLDAQYKAYRSHVAVDGVLERCSLSLPQCEQRTPASIASLSPQFHDSC